MGPYTIRGFLTLSVSHPLLTKTALLILVSLIVSPTTSSSSSSNDSSPDDNSSYSKRGLIYISPDSSDYDVLTDPASPLTWYYNYSPWPSSNLTSWTTNFAPMVHGTTSAATDVDTIKAVLNGSAGVPLSNSPDQPGNSITHVLSFNEPDGDEDSGGSDSSPQHAAQVYIDTLLPLRSEPWNLKLSLPATTGSPRGLEWLRDFNESCHDIQDSGCEFDFVATHWYGDFAGMASWLGQIHELYPQKDVWVTEFAIAGLDAYETEAFMNQSLPYLDGLDYVSRYAWFGTFRSDDANEWTGDGVSMLDDDGALTALGAEYLGGKADGFEEGMGGGAAGVRHSFGLLVVSLMTALMTAFAS
ncbi:uncharacterized protein Z518_07480 [Rhinocladiella mackenziei CBS 650.93]|uniref:Rhinocladiella mackenziei CBS 650.93 unplaced genomic scaffold supercont1.5, whole genome shotgun sequence n=1 Tax=Rhinocladiella mackenziei CBS 650.93 TaxID=1442369 RepID=A0A0D2FP76_9EURO|nr:uncharacterized protein Z518_07480 [Rhinocladiella mackenziei CBS 650.93]KIX03927.1 hypothetical protein Z518_07480 [Rhinocladiella mackenziei CBS 650.93]